MIDEKTVWDSVWPTVERLIEATLAEDNEGIANYVVPGEQAAEMLALFGHGVFDILLKTVLGRARLGLTRAIETENGRHVHIEYAWPDPESTEQGYTAADVVSVRLMEQNGRWLVAEINPASADLPMTGARARGILATSQVLSEKEKVPSEPWILPVALYGGILQLPLRLEAMADVVEELLLPGLQHRTYGVMSIMRGRQLWRDFKAVAKPNLRKPAGWAAAAEFVISKQDMRNQTQAAVGKHYKVGLTMMAPRIKQIEKTLSIQGLDERYTDIQSTRIVYKDE